MNGLSKKQQIEDIWMPFNGWLRFTNDFQEVNLSHTVQLKEGICMFCSGCEKRVSSCHTRRIQCCTSERTVGSGEMAARDWHRIGTLRHR